MNQINSLKTLSQEAITNHVKLADYAFTKLDPRVKRAANPEGFSQSQTEENYLISAEGKKIALQARVPAVSARKDLLLLTIEAIAVNDNDLLASAKALGLEPDVDLLPSIPIGFDYSLNVGVTLPITSNLDYIDFIAEDFDPIKLVFTVCVESQDISKDVIAVEVSIEPLSDGVNIRLKTAKPEFLDEDVESLFLKINNRIIAKRHELPAGLASLLSQTLQSILSSASQAIPD